MATVYKRGKIWWGRVQYAGKEHRVSLETTSKADADRKLIEFISEIKNEKRDEKKYKFDDLVLKFVSEHLPTLKPSAAKRYGVSINQLIDHFEGMSLEDITSAPLSDFENARRAQGVSNSTIRRDLACLSSMFSCAEDAEWITGNPVLIYMRRRAKRGLKEAPPRKRYLNKTEEEKLLAACKANRNGIGKEHVILCAAVAFAIDTGLRKEEQMTLTWSLVDLERKEVKVPDHRAKSGKGRTVPLQDRTLEILKTLPRGGSPYVFFNGVSGTRYYNLRKTFGIAMQTAGIKEFRWHDLRRTCGCRLLQDKGLDILTVSKWLGHSSISVTERVYAFLETEQLHKAIGREK